MLTIAKPVQSIIDQVMAYGKKQRQPGSVFFDFIQLFYAKSSEEDLKAHTVEELYGAVKAEWELLTTRRPKQLKIRVFNPIVAKEGWKSKHTMIAIIMPDMPFLVDSVLMEINRLGVTPHYIIHLGGIRVKRDNQHRVQGVYDYYEEESDTQLEAPIFLEIDKQSDAAALKIIGDNLKKVLEDVEDAVRDWPKMRARFKSVIQSLEENEKTFAHTDIQESKAFLEYLLDNHFTFLGARDYKVVGSDKNLALELVKGSGLGVLKNETKSKIIRKYSDLPAEALKWSLSKQHALIISKTNTRSTVHRPAYTDYIGVKVFDKKGNIIGERRFIGLYTSSVYQTDPGEIPFIRQKVDKVIIQSGLPKTGHAGKDLAFILSTLPRDELLQATEDQLFELSMGILQFHGRRQVRLFIRNDSYGRFLSCFVYVPRENFNTDLLIRMQEILRRAFHATEVITDTQFSDPVLVRVYFIVRIDSTKSLQYSHHEIEDHLIKIARSWHDSFKECLLKTYGEEKGNLFFKRYQRAFPLSYRDQFSGDHAILDIEHIEKLSEENELELNLYHPVAEEPDFFRFKIFRRNKTIPLTDVVPVLENMGLKAISEEPYELRFQTGEIVWINDFKMRYEDNKPLDIKIIKPLFEETFSQVWKGHSENDRFNCLVLKAHLHWRDVMLLRAYAKYFQQINFPLSQLYIQSTLIENSDVVGLLVQLFNICFNPTIKQGRLQKIKEIEKTFFKALDTITILDKDRIFKAYYNIIRATLRTNFYQTLDNQRPKPYLSLKLNPKEIYGVPKPLPMFEIFVYSPSFEGVHLRAGPIARGGLRWSDRLEDFRTEILGLMKAQQVKNAVIVPTGAKGGFVTKHLPVSKERDAMLEEGIRCYKLFISALLDITDNLKPSDERNEKTHYKIVKPVNTVCYDKDDPYLVVAADKGTATFSDIANSISIERGFWLKDAFASGGSSGYDHKKMGITARGAWVSAERHFQELGVNLSTMPIKAVGIGDMSGDVFGNGMLLSPHLQLVAAFNHMHIFLDPDPDPQMSFEERKRLFNLPRSTWADYKLECISKGGGIFERSMKQIKLSAPVQRVLGITAEALEPNELIRAILEAPVDLLWNGGIGTYIKASSESNMEVEDRTNDNLRVDGKEVRARVICEGGNLGCTQLGRIEYELHGGKVNTDFIDNSAGVDCSDHEVNIKILLNELVRHSRLSMNQRDKLLVDMTPDVSKLVLQDNYEQNFAISLAKIVSPDHMDLYIRYINQYDQEGKIDRELEFLPSHKTLIDRKSKHQGLTRPELAVLFSYTKIILKHSILNSSLPELPFIAEMVERAFPPIMATKYKRQEQIHYLARNIIATQLSNYIVSNMGITFIYQMHDETGASIADIVHAFLISAHIFHMEEVIAQIKALDHKVKTDIQYQMMLLGIRAIRRATRWFLRNHHGTLPIEKMIEQFSKPIEILFDRLPKILPAKDKKRLEKNIENFTKAGVPLALSTTIVDAHPMYHALNIVQIAKSSRQLDIYRVAKIYFAVGDRLDLLWFRAQVDDFPIDDHWSVLGKASLKADVDVAHRALTTSVLRCKMDAQSIHGRLQEWFDLHEKEVKRWRSILTRLRHAKGMDFTQLSVSVRELVALVKVLS